MEARTQRDGLMHGEVTISRITANGRPAYKAWIGRFVVGTSRHADRLLEAVTVYLLLGI